MKSTNLPSLLQDFEGNLVPQVGNKLLKPLPIPRSRVFSTEQKNVHLVKNRKLKTLEVVVWPSISATALKLILLNKSTLHDLVIHVSEQKVGNWIMRFLPLLPNLKKVQFYLLKENFDWDGLGLFSRPWTPSIDFSRNRSLRSVSLEGQELMPFTTKQKSLRELQSSALYGERPNSRSLAMKINRLPYLRWLNLDIVSWDPSSDEHAISTMRALTSLKEMKLRIHMSRENRRILLYHLCSLSRLQSLQILFDDKENGSIDFHEVMSAHPMPLSSLEYLSIEVVFPILIYDLSVFNLRHLTIQNVLTLDPSK